MELAVCATRERGLAYPPQYQDAFERAVQDTAQSRVWTQKWARRSATEHVRLS